VKDDVTVVNHWLVNGKHYAQTRLEYVELFVKSYSIHCLLFVNKASLNCITESKAKLFCSEEWLKRMDKNKTSIKPIMESTYGKDSATKWTVYWRTFFIAVAELFGYNNGEEWMVAHFLFKKK